MYNLFDGWIVNHAISKIFHDLGFSEAAHYLFVKAHLFQCGMVSKILVFVFSCLSLTKLTEAVCLLQMRRKYHFPVLG